MEYMQDRSDGIGRPPMEFLEMLEHSDVGGPGFAQYNPYDYENPSEKAKDPGGSPLVVTIPPSIDYGLFRDPEVFKDDGDLKDWFKSRRQDFTTDEEEQRPALSVTRKYAMVQGVIARYLLGHMPVVVPEPEFDGLFLRSKLAASLSDIVDKDFHYKNNLKLDRSGGVNAIWLNQGNPKQKESGFFIFRVSTPGSNSGPHTVYLQFLRGEEEKQYTSYADYPVQFACTCPSFLYHGAQYYAVHDKYMYMPAFRPDLAPPRSQDVFVVHRSETYPMGKKFPGRGLNFRVCKHLLKVYEILQTMKVENYYRKYPITAPPSKVMNVEEWKNLMKFDFTEANIKQRLLSPRPKIPAYFNRENITQSVIDWFNNVWIPRTDEQKIKALHEMVEYPERIFFILIKEAYLKRDRGEKISDRLINEGYDLMARVVQPENKETPQQVEMEGIPKDQKGKGTGAVAPPGGDVPADEFIKGNVGGPSKVEPATKSVEPVSKPMITPKFSPQKAREIAKTLRGVKRDE
jgi:hypothetical protein